MKTHAEIIPPEERAEEIDRRIRTYVIAKALLDKVRVEVERAEAALLAIIAPESPILRGAHMQVELKYTSRTTWDPDLLESLASEYPNVEAAITRRATIGAKDYLAMSDFARTIADAARTVKQGKPTITVEARKD